MVYRCEFPMVYVLPVSGWMLTCKVFPAAQWRCGEFFYLIGLYKSRARRYGLLKLYTLMYKLV